MMTTTVTVHAAGMTDLMGRYYDARSFWNTAKPAPITGTGGHALPMTSTQKASCASTRW